MQSTDSDFPTMLQLTTLTIWLLCVATSITGAVWRLAPLNPHAAPLKQMTIVVSTDMPTMPDSSAEVPTPPVPAAAAPALPPAPPAVAAPAPTIALALPAPNVARTVSPAVAAPFAPAVVHPPVAHAAVDRRPHCVPAAVHHLVLGQGEAQYIKLDYPEEAQLNAEEGSVDVQFTQDNAGHVTEAHLAHPGRWPILNEASLKAIRHTSFPAGQPGIYDITFDFKLQ